MSHLQSVRELAAVLHPRNDARPTIMLGAGASFSSGVPLAGESVKRIARRVYAERVLGPNTPPESVKTSEWREWLLSQPWFLDGDDRLADNFPQVVNHLLRPRDYRRTVLLDLINPSEGIGIGYRHLSELVFRGLAGTILTTNFDECLPRALNDKRPHLRHVAEINRGPQDFREFDIFNRAQIVWLHGKAEQYTDKNLVEEVSELDPNLVQLTLPLLQSTPLIVIGYRGAENSVMTSLLGQTGELFFKKGIYWCELSGSQLHPNVEELQSRIGGNFQLLEIEGFDALLKDLDSELARQQRPLGAVAVKSEPSFDDTPVENATIADINIDHALHTARQYSKKLGLPETTSGTLKLFLRELGLLVDVDGTERPSAAAILLFGREPQRFFPHAVVTVMINGKHRRVISGNLVSQRNSLLEWISDKKVNPKLKLKKTERHEEQFAYHNRALVELVTNLIVHRDYREARPAIIEAQSNHRLVFTNPGIPPEPFRKRLSLNELGEFSPIAELTAPPNRALADIFYGVSAMERAGTGLADVKKYARESDGIAIFKLLTGIDDFRVEIYQPETSGQMSAVARDSRPIGTYVLNFLPFSSLPTNVSRVRVKGTLKSIAKKVPLDEAGTLLLRGDEIWSFAPAAILKPILQSVMIETEVRLSTYEEIAIDPNLSRVFSWLLRKHFESYLCTLSSSGLILEPNRKRNRRAYFVGENAGPRLHIYDTPHRRNVERGVVKQRADDPRKWFENEGITYEIVQVGQTWGVRIKPFYMFTGKDAQTPLPNYARTSKATRRMRFDRNQSVSSDLTFWARFLSQGNPIINIGQVHVNDLLVEGSFLSIEVPEEGLLSDDNSDQNQMSA